MKRNDGFSIVELMVVVAITMLLSGFALSYNRSGLKQIALSRDQSVVVGALQRAKSLVAERFNNEISGQRNCNFGLHFDQGSKVFVLFQNMAPATIDPVADCVSANSGIGTSYRYDASASPSEKLESYNLDPKIMFSNIPVGGLDIVFVPPDLIVKSNALFPVTVTLQTSDGAVSASVVVSSAGQIISQ